jgi:hypothetical protein
MLICILKWCNFLWNGANCKDTLFRVHQTQLLRTATPAGPSTGRAQASRLGPNQQSKLGFDRFGHFGTQSALQMRGAH